MKKRLIAMTVVGFVVSSANAQLDLNDPDAQPLSVYAAEIVIPGKGVQVAAAENVQAELGFSLTDAASRFVRFDLTNESRFVGDPFLTFSNLGAATAPNSVLSVGGDNEGFVLFELAAVNDTPVPIETIVTLNFNASTPNLALEGTTSVQYRLFASGVDGGSDQLASAGPRVLAKFVPALSTGTTSTTDGAVALPVEAPNLIEVADGSLNFEGGSLFTALGSFVSALVPDPPLLASGAAATKADILSGQSIEIDGNFRAAESVTYILDGGGTKCGTAAATLTATINTDKTQAVFTPPTAGDIGTIGPSGVEVAATICMEVTGTDIIEAGSYTGTWIPVEQAGYNVDEVPLVLGTLNNAGANVTLTLMLTPGSEGGEYRNLIRISNTSAVTGTVFIRLINDEGQSAPTLTLGDVTGGNDTLAARASSPQININAIYAAAQAADPTFEVGAAPSNKLRAVITGEFGSMDVQTYTVSQDSTTFSTF